MLSASSVADPTRFGPIRSQQGTVSEQTRQSSRSFNLATKTFTNSPLVASAGAGQMAHPSRVFRGAESQCAVVAPCTSCRRFSRRRLLPIACCADAACHLSCAERAAV
jgi:hypothetical protein